MYQLLHNGDIAPMDDADAAPELPTGPGSSSGWSERRTRLDIEDWRHFTSGGDLRGSSPLLDSWKRCREKGVDPAMPNCGEFVPVAVIGDQLDQLDSLGRGVETMVVKALGDRDLLMTVTDAGGRILRTVGSRKVLVQADSLRFGPGAVWTEESVGTNAIALALTTQAPWQVMGTEHFCSSHHSWGCSATPVFSPLGDLWGCVDISGHLDCGHEKALWITLAAARELERRLLALAMGDVEHFSRSMLKAAFGSVPSGLCIVDDRGFVTFANPEARRLLTPSAQHASGTAAPGELRGRSAASLFGCPGRSLVEALREGRALSCPANPGLVVEVTPFVFKKGASHFVLVLREGGRRARATVPEGLACAQTSPSAVGTPAAGAQASDSGARGSRPSAAGTRDDPFAGIVHRSDAMREVVEKARTLARSDAPVLILGETGTGKELFARALHLASSRAAGSFVAVNCGAIPRDLIQSELFGHERGSFTGATRQGQGKFELAHGGTLFLDEISEMPLEMQVNLLRPLETRKVTRVGGSRPLDTDFRLVTATNRNLEELVAAGRFREDLYYRIHVLLLELPPLRERRGDVVLLADAFGRRLARKHRLQFAGFGDDALACMESYPWPGNVRQLEHSIEYAVNMAMGARITMQHLPRPVCRDQFDAVATVPSHASEAEDPDFSLCAMERRTIESALRHHNGNILKTARALGIGRNTLYAKMRKYRLTS